MKKVLLITMGIIIGASITTYAAYKYKASDIGYSPDNSEFKVDNVESAIDELYNKVNNEKFYLYKAGDYNRINLENWDNSITYMNASNMIINLDGMQSGDLRSTQGNIATYNKKFAKEFKTLYAVLDYTHSSDPGVNDEARNTYVQIGAVDRLPSSWHDTGAVTWYGWDNLGLHIDLDLTEKAENMVLKVDVSNLDNYYIYAQNGQSNVVWKEIYLQ